MSLLMLCPGADSYQVIQPPGPDPSLSGTRIPSPDALIIDNAANMWTLGTGTTPNIQIKKNGTQVGSTVGAQILWYQDSLYIQGSDLNWYLWNGTTFTLYGASDPVGSTTLMVVPGAYGYGMDTRAAYGAGTNPTIYRVTSLANSGAGTLRAAMEASGPRVVVFEVSGYIDLDSDIQPTSPYLTVAGQTAPPDGITLRYAGIQVRTHDVLLQHFRIRTGWVNGISLRDASPFGVYPGNLSQNVVLDHMSISWGADENVYLYYGLGGGDLKFTFWRSITSEGLRNAPNFGHPEDGKGFLVTENTTKVSIIQSLFAHDFVRNPYGQNGCSVSVINNVIFDWYRENGIDFESHSTVTGGAWKALAVGNRFIVGPNTIDGPSYRFYYYRDASQTGMQIYRSDNTVSGSGTTDEDNLIGFDPNVGSPPTGTEIPTGYTPIASTALESALLAHVGARPTNRDDVDTRVIHEVASRTGAYFPSTQDDVGGWPTIASATRGLTTPGNPHHVQSSGYTDLEVWLHNYSAGVES